jgi:hypothetical protein
LFHELTDQDLVELLPAITRAIERLAPSNEMFGDGVRLAGLDLLSRLHIREGMSLCVTVMEPGRWGAGNRLPKCLEYLGRYGAQAKVMLPQLKEIRGQLAATESKQAKSERVELLDKCIASIENSKANPTLVGLGEFQTRPSAQ